LCSGINHLIEIDNEITQDMLNVKPISSKTLRKYILSLTPLVEKSIAEQLPGKFGLLFDGWTAKTVHYVALKKYVNNAGIQKEHLLALAPLITEEELGAQQHVEFIEATLALYSKTLSNVVVLIADNCNTNRKISTTWQFQVIASI
jgi:hypothetical protein